MRNEKKAISINADAGKGQIMRIQDMVLVIENTKGSETNMLMTVKEYKEAYLFLSLFWKNKISLVTSVPASALNALFGSLTAPTSSARSARYFRTLLFFLSIVPFVVITATIPPGLTLSMDFATK